MHCMYGTLQRHFPQGGGLRTLLPKLVFTQLIVNPFVFLPLFYVWTGAVLGRTFDQTVIKARAEAWTTLKVRASPLHRASAPGC